MNLLILSPGADTGGQGYRIKRAFDRYRSGWKTDALHTSGGYFNYPSDKVWDRELGRALYAEADVVHHKQRLELYPFLERGERKPTIIHHQGSRLRGNSAAVNIEALSIGATQLVSTIDLLGCCTRGRWLPSPFDLDDLMRYRDTYRKNRGPIVIAHAPTNREVKGTRHVLEAIANLQKRYDIEFDLIESVEWRVCLSRKSRAHIYIDQFDLGYGNNAIEAWGMGIPVVAGVTYPGARARMRKAFDGQLPFFDTKIEELEAQLARLIESAELREEWGAIGRAHAERFHAEAAVVDLLEQVYLGAKPSKGAEFIELAGRPTVASA